MDETLLLWINQDWANPGFDVFFHWISQRASFSFPLLGLLLVFYSWRFKHDGAKLWLTLVLLVGVGDGLGNIIKHSTDQLRPCAAQPELVRQVGQPANTPCGNAPNGMPSNHALNFFATAAFLSLVMRSWRWSASLFTLALLVSLSRIYLGKHYPLQVLAGATIGTLLGFLGAWIGLKYLGFMWRIQPQRRL
jgi:undecaprenyl-diphosphatase